MNQSHFWSDKKLLIRQAVAAWLLLHTGLVFFVTYALLLTYFFSFEKEYIIILTFSFTFFILLASYILLQTRDYHLFLPKSEVGKFSVSVNQYKIAGKPTMLDMNNRIHAIESIIVNNSNLDVNIAKWTHYTKLEEECLSELLAKVQRKKEYISYINLCWGLSKFRHYIAIEILIKTTNASDELLTYFENLFMRKNIIFEGIQSTKTNSKSLEKLVKRLILINNAITTEINKVLKIYTGLLIDYAFDDELIELLNDNLKEYISDKVVQELKNHNTSLIDDTSDTLSNDVFKEGLKDHDISEKWFDINKITEKNYL